MRSVLLPLMILILVNGIAVADSHNKELKPSKGFSKERVIKMKSGKFSRMFRSLIHKTRDLDLSQKQKNKVAEVDKEYFPEISISEGESRNLQIAFMQELKGGTFDPEDLKVKAKKISELELKSADAFIDSLSEIRDAVGPENFAKLYPVTKIHRHALIELRDQDQQGQTEYREKAESVSDVKTKNDSKSGAE